MRSPRKVFIFTIAPDRKPLTPKKGKVIMLVDRDWGIYN